MEQKLKISIPLNSDGSIPKKYTGFGEDILPEITIENLSSDVVSLAIIMDDLDVPFSTKYNHFIAWNIKPTNIIEEDAKLECVGIGYGKHRYRGPNIPIFMKKPHRYEFTVLALDIFISNNTKINKKQLLKLINNHILQSGSIIGWYKRK